MLLLVTAPTKINIGVRHVLVIYPFLAIAAGYGVVLLWRVRRGRVLARATAAGLLGWHLVASALAHPDYLPYFNEFAGSHPERYLLGADLDWGQDLYRLRAALRARNVEAFSIAWTGRPNLDAFEFPPFEPLEPHRRVSGWIAISLLKRYNDWTQKTYPYDGYAWLDAYEPVAMIGKSIRLYYIPEGGEQ